MMTLRQVSDLIAYGLSGPPPAGDVLDRGVAALSRIAENDYFPDVLREIRDNMDSVSHCAELSHRHPLGFDKIVLIDAMPAYMLRLHVWWPGCQPEVEHIHNHRFSAVSTLLAGYCDMEVFGPGDTGVPMIEYREIPGPERGIWVLERTGVARLQSLLRVRMGKGDHYALPSDALHLLSVPGDVLCATLFLAIPDVTTAKSETRVISRTGGVLRSPKRSRTLQPGDYREILDLVAGELTS